MSRKTASARAGQDRASPYDEITDKIIAKLESGRVPWVQPGLAMPRNAATGRHYSGINALILWGAVIERGFPGQGWLTFRQALSLGGNVRKGVAAGSSSRSARLQRAPAARKKRVRGGLGI